MEKESDHIDDDVDDSVDDDDDDVVFTKSFFKVVVFFGREKEERSPVLDTRDFREDGTAWFDSLLFFKVVLKTITTDDEQDHLGCHHDHSQENTQHQTLFFTFSAFQFSMIKGEENKEEEDKQLFGFPSSWLQ